MKVQSRVKLAIFAFLLMVNPSFADSNLASDAAKLANKTVNLVKDSSITGYIYAQIALDDSLSQEGLNVSTTKGVVTLEGTVDSDTEASSVVQMASSAAGVVSVDATQLKIKKSKQPITDMIITAKIKGTYIREKLLDDKDLSGHISVETKNGVVYLSGMANNALQAQNAVNLAQGISGVTRVESTIKVKAVQ